MTNHDDLEQRLKAGLSRWAAAGEPSLNLEALVREQAGAGSATSAAPRPRLRRPARALAAGVAAVATVALALVLSFPAWVGAAAGWPVVGPALTEIVLKDAGLAWAYQNGLIHGTVAETQVGQVHVRVLGVLADPVRTTVIYQVTGWTPPERPAGDRRPIPANSGWFFSPWDRPADNYPRVFIAKIDGEGVGSGMQTPIETPLGLVGTVSAGPLPAETGTLELSVALGAEHVTLPVEASRADADRLSREVAVGQSQSFDGVTITVKSVIFTPVETVVHYGIKRSSYYGMVVNPEGHYIEQGGKRFPGAGASGSEGDLYESFPPVQGPFTIVIPSEAKAVPVNLVWPLQGGARQELGGMVLELQDWQQEGQRLGVRWLVKNAGAYEGIAEMTVLDAAGRQAPPPTSGEGVGYSREPGSNTIELQYETAVPRDFTPAAVRAAQVGVRVSGPWRFTIP